MWQAVTGHIATVRKQGGENGGKVEQKVWSLFCKLLRSGFKQVIILKNQFNGKSGEDIWSSLILSLPAEEVSKMAPRDQINSRGAGEGEEEEEEEVQPKSEPESETVEVEADEKDFEEEETPVELVRLEAAAPKGGKMSKTKTVKDLSQEYDKFARLVIQQYIQST